MTLKHLRVFVAVCEQGGITRAAEALHMVQPAVSTTISELEKYYQAALFDRIHQRLVLTELGRELLVKAKNILSEFENFEETATLGGRTPRLRIGSSLTLGKTVLPRFLELVRDRLPQLELTLIVERTAVIEEKLECGELDLAMIEGELRSAHLKKVPFGEDRLLAVCSPEYPVSAEMMPTELIRHPLLLREKGSASRALLDKALLEARLSVTPYAESISNEALVALAKGGHGIAVLPEGIVNEALLRQELRSLTVVGWSLSRTHYIVMRNNKRLNAQCQQAIDLLKQEAVFENSY